MRNIFVTYSYGESYNDLTDVMIESTRKLSNFPIEVYHTKPKETKSELEKFVEMCRMKIVSCVDAIEMDLADNYVWIDGDTIVHKNIDKIWFENKRIENYPLLGKYRYKNFTFFEESDFPSRKLCDYLGINQDFYIYRQANLMLFNKGCLPFFNEVLSIMDSGIDPKLMPMGDESVMNALFCKYNYTNNLGHINLCSDSFEPADGLKKFIRMKNREDYFNIWTIHENNYEDILIFHGQKNVDIAKDILNNIIEVWK